MNNNEKPSNDNSELFGDLKYKFMLLCSAIGTGILLVIFTVVFGIAYGNMTRNVKDSLNRTISDYQISGGFGREFKNFDGMTNCIVIVKRDGIVVEKKRLEPYTPNEQAQIINKVLNTKREKIEIGSRHFWIQKARTNNPVSDEIVYAVCDYSADHRAIITLVVTFGIVTVACVWLFALLGWLFARKAVKPVENAFNNQKELVANVSHELKTPLTVIATDLNLISDSLSDNPDAKKWLTSSNQQIEKMNHLVFEMLELSKFQSAFYQPDKKLINLSEYLESTLLSFEATCFEKNITLETKIENDIYFMVDTASLDKLLSILCDNAIKYVNVGGKIRAGLERNKKTIRLTISNTGNGISAENQMHIFERFYKVTNEESEKKSFGLGLSIAKSIVDTMDGKIECQSEEGKYTMFTITLFGEAKKEKEKKPKKLKPLKRKQADAEQDILS